MTASPARRRFDAVIVGAGFAGLYMLHRLRKLGLSVRVLEAGSGIGGTWYWNRYPGARCDVESLDYSYSFDDDLQQTWTWSERYATQPELMRYIDHVADRFDLRRDIQLDTRVAAATFDEATALWSLVTTTDETFEAPFCIMATGCLSVPNVPAFPGQARFRGPIYHTGTWPHDGVDFTGLRVGVIGTGSSGVQAIPVIAAEARHLTVFQRTAHYSVPAWTRPLAADEVAAYKAQYAEKREDARRSPLGIAGIPSPTKSALEDTPEERARVFEAGWRRGTTGFTRLYKDIVLDEAANALAADFVRQKIRETVKDPAVAELLLPTEFPIAARRLILDTDYYETYNRPNVSLVDVKRAPIETLTETGVQTTRAHYDLDAIVFATGFDAMTGALDKIDIRTSSGATLRAKWQDGPRAYLGLMAAGFPNLFLITGPGSPSVLSNMIHSIEQHVDWITDCLAHLRAHGLTRIEAEEAAEAAWVDHVTERANQTLMPRGNSWYLGANVPGKPRVFMPYAGGTHVYRQTCEDVVAHGYRGFRLS